ncbi:MAG: S8 family serine peptidase [Alistipes sp.]|nr:S8 family serine peptidase [Alistipes sp.]
MNKVKFLSFAMVALLAASCVQEPEMESSKQSLNSAAAKIANTPADAVQGELILYVDEATAKLWSESGSMTRSGNEHMSNIAASIGAESVEQVFNMSINGDLKRAQNLHRWFVVKFDAETQLDVAANKLAEMPEVSTVQYNKLMARPKTAARSVVERPATRANEMPYNDPMLELQWHYNNTGSKSISQFAKKGEDIGAFGAWNYTKGNRDVVVAVVDEGVMYSHTDLVANMWVNEAEKNGAAGVDDDKNGWVDDIYGVNACDMNGNISWNVAAWDSDGEYVGDTGHGTHVAGTISAVNNNGIGVCGVAGGSGNGDGVRIMSIQVFDGPDSSGDAKTAKGVEYAADNGASILQNSWGYTTTTLTDQSYRAQTPLLFAAINYFISVSNCAAMDGNIVIFAAGNESYPGANYPGGYNEYIAVTAYAPDGLPTTYTNYKFGCNVAAPGGEGEYQNRNYIDASCVLSTIPADTPDPYNSGVTTYGTDYGYMQGTSMACPHVSGVAALVLSYALENGIHLTAVELNEILTSSVREIDSELKGKSKTAYAPDARPFTFNLDGYAGGMGTGKLDAVLAIMNLRGATCVPVTVGEEIEIDINKLMGTGNLNVTVWKDFSIDPAVKESLGIKGETVFGNKVILTCTKPGIGVIVVKFIAGGTNVGGGNTPGGKLVEKEIVLISREANDNAGWL